jgi:hypothetical protein
VLSKTGAARLPSAQCIGTLCHIGHFLLNIQDLRGKLNEIAVYRAANQVDEVKQIRYCARPVSLQIGTRFVGVRLQTLAVEMPIELDGGNPTTRGVEGGLTPPRGGRATVR